jgi:hypothetical protein
MMDNYRTHPLYKLAREVSGQPINWDNPGLAHLQHEMRVDYVEHMPTLNLISTVLRDEEDVVDWSMTLAQINSLVEQVLDLDMALGQGRR